MARVSASDRHALPEDAIYEILLRLPAKDLCRLRAVCRPWRSLLSDPVFAAAHAARHPEPLIVAGYAKHFTNKDGGVLFDIMDLSGHVVRRVRRQVSNAVHDEDDEQMVSVKSMQGDLVCLVNRSHGSCRLLDLATGAVRVLPEELAEEHAIHEASCTSDNCNIDFAFGQVAATGEHKVLRVLDYFCPYSLMLCEVFTINGGGGGHGQWRARAAPPDNVQLCVWNSVTINGIVYFLSTEFVEGQDFMPDTIAPFNLESEEWMPTIRGPLSSLEEAEEADDLPKRMSLAVLNGYLVLVLHIVPSSLAVLNGYLVLVLHIVPSSMDLWFLIDAKKGSWVKQQSIQLNFNCWQDDHRVYPLVVLNDGGVVLVCMGDKVLLKICDPRIGISTDGAEIIGPCDAVGLYTGNLLSLANHPSQ